MSLASRRELAHGFLPTRADEGADSRGDGDGDGDGLADGDGADSRGTDGDGAGTGSVPAPSRRTWTAWTWPARRAGPSQAPDCTSMSSSRILSLWARAWCPQKSSSPPEGRTARTFAAAPQRSQRSATVSSGRDRVPGCTAVSLRLDTGVAPVSLDATNRLRGTSTLPDARHPGAIPGARRDSRHVVTKWRSGHLCGDRPGVVRPSD